MIRVDSEEEDYRVWVGGYSGNASDSLSAHNGYKFSTVDRNNDLAPQCCPCAPAYGGGWWFYRCKLTDRDNKQIQLIISAVLRRTLTENISR